MREGREKSQRANERFNLSDPAEKVGPPFAPRSHKRRVALDENATLISPLARRELGAVFTAPPLVSANSPATRGLIFKKWGKKKMRDEAQLVGRRWTGAGNPERKC